MADIDLCYDPTSVLPTLHDLYLSGYVNLHVCFCYGCVAFPGGFLSVLSIHYPFGLFTWHICRACGFVTMHVYDSGGFRTLHDTLHDFLQTRD